MTEIERIKSGIPGLDQITGGGIPRNQLLMLTGTTGTGKTVFCTQFLYEGATKYKEPGVYLSFEDPEVYIKSNAKVFGWDLEALEKKGMFAFIKYDPYKISDVLEMLESTIREIGATRIVIDSISALGLYVKDDSELRRMIFDLVYTLRKLNCTTIMTSEMIYKAPGLSRHGVEEFVADSVIVLHYERMKSAFIRAVQIWKIFSSKHSQILHPYKITDKGLTVFPDEEAFVGL